LKKKKGFLRNKRPRKKDSKKKQSEKKRSPGEGRVGFEEKNEEWEQKNRTNNQRKTGP